MPKVDRVIPLLVYRDIPAAHNFLVNAFGFHAEGVVRRPDGQAVHGEVQAGETTIWLHRATSEHSLDSPLGPIVSESGIVVQVDDVDAHYKQARAAGANIETEPVDQPCGQREYGVRDPEALRQTQFFGARPRNHVFDLIFTHPNDHVGHDSAQTHFLNPDAI
jgi:uncharacterized glyoxalase superfamily protein PhnB